MEAGTSTDPFRVDPTGTTTQPVSGTVTANAGAGTFTTDPSDRDARILGRAKIHDGTDTALVSGTGSLQVTCDNCGAPSTFADNSAFTFGTTGITNVGAVVDDTATNTVTENSAGTPRMNTNRILYFNPRNNAGTEIATAANPFRVDPTGATIQPVSGTVAVSNSFLLDATFTGRINTQGQKAMSASTPVVLASDQSGPPDKVGATVALNALNAAASVALDGRAGASVNVDAGTLAGTVVVEVSSDGGVTYPISVPFWASHLSQRVGSVVFTNPSPAANFDPLMTAGITHLRIRVSAFTSGTANAHVRASNSISTFALAPTMGFTGIGAYLSTNPLALVTGGVDATPLIQAFQLRNAVPVGTEQGLITRPIPDLDSDSVNTLKTWQIGGHASPSDLPPAAVSAAGDRVRGHFDRYGAQVVRPRKIRESYTAVARLAEAAARLDQTFTHVANTNKQWSTLHHTAAATKELRLQRVQVRITAFTVATQFVLELRELSSATPPATGNPAITPRAHRIGTGAAEATCLYLPSTQGSEAAANSPLGHFSGDWAVWAAPAAQTQNGDFVFVLYDASQEDDEVLPPTAPVGVYGGWAVMLRTVGIPAVRMTVIWKFTEEIP